PMGFSISAATALIFASLFLAFGIFYPAMANGYERVEDADAAKADRDLKQAQTDIELVKSSNKTTGNDDLKTLNITVDNTGQTTLTVDEVDLLVDGNYIAWSHDTNKPVRSTVDGDVDTNLWLPNETLVIQYGKNTNPINNDPPYYFKVVTEHGVSISGVEN
ncbi:MAG: hypothetical protein ABEH61_02370, partial [Haloarculaceae archaeon]